ncbi:hypothetical protein [Methylobacter sp.]|uniref:hypothetical protein n=1 Tax=Methylobacter sp. TaxID=2051955 RepID=UPI001214DF46|nr:hypothetical protein [Methylobacter sp.]TAK61295.1 MAG: hypothetical protein EPO18_14190 [Methylobacter sp.]
MIDDQRLVYHTGSGDTHWLGAESGFVFDLLWKCKAPMNHEFLIAQARQNGFNQLDSLLLEEILKGLCALHLVKIS